MRQCSAGKKPLEPKYKDGGNQLLDFETIPFFIHNDSSPTNYSGDNQSAPDVTLSYGIVETKATNWLNLDDDLGSPHHGLLLQFPF